MEEVFHNCVDWGGIIEKKDQENLEKLRKKDEEIKEARDRYEEVLKELAKTNGSVAKSNGEKLMLKCKDLEGEAKRKDEKKGHKYDSNRTRIEKEVK